MPITSSVCRFEHFNTEWYWRFAPKFSPDRRYPSDDDPRRDLHRKTWEFAAIAAALNERGILQLGRRGLGFAVGREPLPSLFASFGADILATDQLPEDALGWQATGQHADSIEALFNDRLVARDIFDARVKFRHADMNALDNTLGIDQFDFLWSSCAFEHLGSLRTGMDFVCNSMRFLRRGGIAVHTTEYNVSSNDKTIEVGGSVIYRRKDIEDLDRQLRKLSCGIEAIDFDAGTHVFDLDYDREPYYTTGRKHIKLLIGDFVCTSLLLIIRKA